MQPRRPSVVASCRSRRPAARPRDGRSIRLIRRQRSSGNAVRLILRVPAASAAGNTLRAEFRMHRGPMIERFARRVRRASRRDELERRHVAVRRSARPTNAPSTATAAGVTPGMRSAWPSVSGAPASAAERLRATGRARARREIGAESGAVRPSCALDLALLPPQVAGVLHRGFRARDVERRRRRRSSSKRGTAVRPRRLREADLRLPQQLARRHAFAGRRRTQRLRRAIARFRSNRARRASNRSHRSSSTRPASRPVGVSRRSALSIRSSSRCSARDVNMRYGSRQPLVIRSSTRMPMYASSRRSSNARRAERRSCAALTPATSPCAAASS